MRRGGGGSLAAAVGQDPFQDDEQPAFGRRELRVLLPYLRPHARRGLLAMALLIASQIGALATPYLLRYGIDVGIAERDMRALNIAGGLMVVAAVVHWFGLRRSTLIAGEAGEEALQSIRVNVFRHLTSLDIGFFEREKAGKLVARLTSDVETIELLVTEALVQMGVSAFYLVGSVTVLFLLDVKLAALSLIVVIPATTVAMAMFRTRSERAYNRVRERIGAVLSFMQETVRGVHVVQAFGRERVNAEAFREVNNDWRDANVESFRLGSRFFPVVELIGLAGTLVVLAYGGWRAFTGDLTIGVLAAFVLYLSSTMEPIQALSQLYDTFQSAMAGLAKLAGLLEEQPRILDRPGASPLAAARGEEALEEVTFSYRDGMPPALESVDVSIGAGDVIALVGPTGAGKSSIAKLLLRFYDPTAGRVTLDERDLRDVTIASLRETMSLVPQEGFLFGTTIRENIRFSRPEASDEDVETACRTLGIDDMIRRLPDGYDTQVRERGAALSGGERQLIALARALLADPKILILDEATSALDAATEARVEAALRTATAGRTTVVIAHRLSTARRANWIGVVDHGRIVESGTHDELVDRPDGIYARLYRHWLATS